jgi:nicotinamidase-related amidase
MHKDGLISADDSFVLAVDFQEKLATAMADMGATQEAALALFTGASALGIPIAITEHCASAIGPTLTALRDAADGAKILPKVHFSAAREVSCLDYLRKLGRRQVILCGMEAHVCVLQTAFGLTAAGFDVHVVADAVTSRDPRDRFGGIARMADRGIQRVTAEMVLFEWVERADSKGFKALLPVIKGLKKNGKSG